jgi:hypothetical protein
MELTTKQHELLEAVRTRQKAPNQLSIEEFAIFLGVSVRTIRRRHAHGKALGKNPKRVRGPGGPGTSAAGLGGRPGGSRMYPVSEVLAWLEASSEGGTYDSFFGATGSSYWVEHTTIEGVAGVLAVGP